MERLNTVQAATYIGCSPHTLKKSRYTGILLGNEAPAYLKLGTRVVYTTAVLDIWLSEIPFINNTADLATGRAS